MKGVFQKALVIDLSNRRHYEESVPDDAYRHFLGGKGLGAYLLLKRNKPGVDPLGADNNLIFTLGPVSDTKIWGSSRYAVITKSPLTGLFGEAYSGGRLAEPMSRTGYDAIILEGISPTPVWLEITDHSVLFHDASRLWGLDTYATEAGIQSELGVKGSGILVIGPAGENMVRFAAVVNNRWRCAGRTGTGAVMGSKKVKGIAFHGRRVRQPADPGAVTAMRDEWGRKSRTLPSAATFKKVGTPGLVALINTVEAFPTRYWYEGTLEGWGEISAEALHSRYAVKPRSCNRCFMACGRLTTITEGKHAGLTIDGPEYETLYAFGGICMIRDLSEIIRLNDLCDRLGLDTISAGNLAGFAIEASKRGKVAERFDYGDGDAVARIIEQTAGREGIGAVLAEGIRHAAAAWDLEDIAIHVKGLEPGGYDPRYFKAMGLSYATSDRGACHARTTGFRPELAGAIPPEQTAGKAEVVIDYEDRLTLQDALILCRFYRDIYMWPELGRIVEATLGLSLSREGLQRIASTVRDAVRIFNLREGMTGEADTLPRRFFEEPVGSGRTVITREDLAVMKAEYYALRGWNEKGEPLRPLPVDIT